MLRHCRKRLLDGLDRFLNAAVHDGNQVVIRIQPDLVEPAERETERFQFSPAPGRWTPSLSSWNCRLSAR